MNIKIFGAGSIGNHLSQAARRMGWNVTVVDTDPAALQRMREDIYPSRYGAWDEAIKQYVAGEEPKGGFDMIMIGTPPHVRTKVALEALKEKPKILFLEKPVSFPFDANLKKLQRALQKSRGTIALVGYDHAVALSIQRVVALLKGGTIGTALTLDVEFREHWEGIFKAHPWLSGPQDSYLGYWQRGGGASGEHSHALHLAQYLLKEAKLGTWKNARTLFKVEKKGKVEYDSIATFLFRTEKGNIGRVVQDVVTKPTRKWARIQGNAGFIEWICNGHPTGDVVRYAGESGETKEEIIEKKRPDDFLAEMKHIDALVRKEIPVRQSPLAFETGIAVMQALEAAWKEHARR